jgi:hypothetical protein
MLLHGVPDCQRPRPSCHAHPPPRTCTRQIGTACPEGRTRIAYRAGLPYQVRMSDDSGTAHRPGEIVAESGIYQCDCGQSHPFSTDVKGHRFPPLPEGCTGSGWKLQTPAHPGN